MLGNLRADVDIAGDGAQIEEDDEADKKKEYRQNQEAAVQHVVDGGEQLVPADVNDHKPVHARQRLIVENALIVAVVVGCSAFAAGLEHPADVRQLSILAPQRVLVGMQDDFSLYVVYVAEAF